MKPTFESYIVVETFLAQWKKQRLVVLPKPQNSLGAPFSYHIIGLLNTMRSGSMHSYGRGFDLKGVGYWQVLR